MSRVRAHALALVNWKGVFYARYELDRHVTALEGDNGAGKTTVMIAAYVVLLPDMTRLRFTNLGETGATGGDKGLWGRLGDPGRPAYAALDFRLPDGARVIAGVHLERKGEPTVEPTPFLVTGLTGDVRLQDVLLLSHGETEGVPELGELRENAARHGGRLQPFASARDYFGALFDLGVTPMRLGTDEDRNKLNEMLRTSMTGGMSRGLLSELRSFLLKEEGGLAETLQRMRANLDACRRTRTEVAEAQRLEREIGEIYEAGEQMFAAAIAATRQRAEEMSRRVEAAAREQRDAEVRLQEAEQALAATRNALQRTIAQEEMAETEVREAEATERRVAEAVRWAEEAATRLAERRTAEDAERDARQARARAEEAFDAASRVAAEARRARDEAAAGLADLQRGLDELHRRAHAHRRVVEALGEARRKLGRADLAPEAAEAARRDDEARLHAVDEARRTLARRLADAARDRAEHAEAVAALEVVLGRSADIDDAHAQARAALRRVEDWRRLAGRRDELRRDRARAEADAGRQQDARARAAALGLTWAEGEGRGCVEEALGEVEVAIAEAEERARREEAAATLAERALADAQGRLRALERREVAWRALVGHAVHVGNVAGTDVADRASFDEARWVLREQEREGEARLRELRDRRDALEREARDLLQSGGSFPPDLLRIRDELTAELVASHFDHVGVDEAGEIEALLGPLAHALVVADLDAATARLRQRPETLDTVWLVAEDTALSVHADRVVGRAGERDVVVEEREARRVTRIPAKPTLGRAAREQRAADLRAEAEALVPHVEEAAGALRRTREALAAADALLAGVEVWLEGDPASEVEATRRAAAEASAEVARARADAQAARAQATALAPRRAALRDLLGDATLLDPPDHGARAARLREELEVAQRAASELARVGDAPERLDRTLDALRRRPLSEAEVEAERARLAALNAERDALHEGLAALHTVVEHLEALAWTDAEEGLRSQQELVPALRDQHEASVRAVARAEAVEEARREDHGRAVTQAQEAHGRLVVAQERHEEAITRLAELGVEAPTPEALARATAAVACAREVRAALRARCDALREEQGTRSERAEEAARLADRARAALEDERKQARPALEAWERLWPRAEEAGVLEGALTERFERAFGGLGNVNVWQHALTARARLLERLRHAKGAEDVLDAATACLDGSDQSTAEGYLGAWLAVRDWLRRRLPAQIAEVDEPLVALARLRDHLAGLEERLARQERDLRGESEDVARGIEVQVRKAHGRVRRLNEHLRGIRFGSIQGIRVQFQRVERMEQVLRALRTGEAQELLFSASMPVEEALDEIFRRYGGGRGGGQRLLDYREYIHLQVEILRHDATAWEVANPTRLSTGEAIGVGAALMMVVLTEWERDATLLRGRRAHGSMRFLFLDEANRLDQANLGTIFDLCRTLDLQLLVAAPEVARAEGCTVFRLVRTRTEDGREDVLVSGRRVVGEA